MNGMIHLNINCIDAMKLEEGDKVECTYSMVENRIGQIFTITKGNVTKKESDKGYSTTRELSFFSSYGDKFIKL